MGLDARLMRDMGTGLPAVQLPNGGMMPVGLTAQQAADAGLPLPPMVPDASQGPTGPSPEQIAAMRRDAAVPGAGMPMGPPPAPAAPFVAGSHEGPARQAPDAWRQPSPGSHGGGMVPDARFNGPGGYVVDAPAGAESAVPAGVDPKTLVRAGAGGGAPGQPGGVSDQERLIQLAGDQAVSRVGGGGPRRLGEVGETRKIHQLGAVPEAVTKDAEESRRASGDYDQALAAQMRDQQDSGYQAYVAEQQSRLGAAQAQRDQYEFQQKQLKDYEAKRDALATEAAQMKAPQMEDYWGSRSTGAKMATALAITLGGALQGLRGGSNPGMEASDREIDRWVNGQREAYQRARGKVDDADNQYAKMVSRFESQNLAEQHLRMQAYDIRDNMLKSYAEKVGTPNAMEAYQQAMLQSQAQRDQAKVKAYQDAGAEIEQKFTMQGGGGGAGGTNPLLKRLRAEAEAKELLDKRNGVQSNKDPKGAELLGAYNGLDALKRPVTGDGKPWTPEGQNIAGKVARVVTDVVGGDSTYKNLALDANERASSDSFSTRRQALISIGTQLSGAGAPSEGEAVRSAAANAQTEEQLNNVIETYRPVVAAKLKAYGRDVPSTNPNAAPSFEAEH